jgi:Helix-turn-helix domain
MVKPTRTNMGKVAITRASNTEPPLLTLSPKLLTNCCTPAAELHLAPGYLVRLFNAATGLPPMAYLGQLRAEHAAVLLLHSDEPVTSIGRAVGWPDQSGFARRFKAHYGLSATTYRKRFATRGSHLHLPAAAAS